MLRTKPRRTRKNTQEAPTFIGKHLVIDTRVCHGEMTFRGTRVPVETVLLYLAKGHSVAYIRKSWPEVKPEAIEEALSLATESFVERYRG